ncbi:MAG: cation:proton antiporter [bacterium]
MHLLGIVLCLLLMALIRWLGSVTGGGGEQPTLVLAMGFVLLAAFVSGRTSHRIHLPRITGYLLLGVLVGPHALNLITTQMSEGLLFVNGLAVSLIALSAGGELKMEWIADRFRQILTISLVGTAVVFFGVFGTVFLLIDLLPFLPGDSLAVRCTVALVFGCLAVANSPMVVIALITEMDNRGPLARIVLGVTVLRDVLVIVLFSVVLTIAQIVLGGQAVSTSEFVSTIGREIIGSTLLGILIGGLIALCVRYVWREMPLLVILVCFFMAYLATSLHVDPLLMGLAAGFFVENVVRTRGPQLVDGIERCSLPVYCLFFGLAGISLDIGALSDLWPVALILASVRCAGLWAGTYLGGIMSSCEREIIRFGWLGFIANAGVLLAIGSVVARTFPEWGKHVQTLVVALIGINLLIGPIAFRYALAVSSKTQEV